MARPLRIEYPNALYHVTSRGNRQEAVFRDAIDRRMLLDIVSAALARFDAGMLAYCLMGNHYHFVMLTRQANLSRVMREINARYTAAFNTRHRCAGHLFQGRYKAIVVDRDAYLATVCRYVELNPVRAGLVSDVAQWPWSSFTAQVGQRTAPAWLLTSTLRTHFLQRLPRTAEEHGRAALLYERFVREGIAEDLWRRHLRADIFLGDAAFVERVRQFATCAGPATTTPSTSALDATQALDGAREEAARRAWTEGGASMAEIAQQLGVSVATVSRLIARAEGRSGR